MTRKKHEENGEIKNNETGNIIDNKNINSGVQGTVDEIPVEMTGVTDVQQPEEGQKEKPADSSEQSDKETINVDENLVKLAEMQDKYLRLSAEFDNYRKRTLREKIELTKHAGESILKSIIPVMDDFERALKSMESSSDCTSMKSGIDLIYSKFRDFLTQNGIKEIESLNSEFNVDLHEAVSKMPVEDGNLKGKVVEVLQKGYYLHDKVMRFSKVVVGE
ncbi:MAG TPA: nucleotide exchange factor GrpE [Bacteroidales bacterium]|nr:nucleotide exchange factor GrpE [Bacteroidales bacterium]